MSIHNVRWYFPLKLILLITAARPEFRLECLELTIAHKGVCAALFLCSRTR